MLRGFGFGIVILGFGFETGILGFDLILLLRVSQNRLYFFCIRAMQHLSPPVHVALDVLPGNEPPERIGKIRHKPTYASSLPCQ